MPRRVIPLGQEGRSSIWDGTYENPVLVKSCEDEDDYIRDKAGVGRGDGAIERHYYKDGLGNYWEEVHHPDGTYELWTTDNPGDPGDGDSWREAEEGEEPMGFTSRGQEAPPLRDRPIGEVLELVLELVLGVPGTL